MVTARLVVSYFKWLWEHSRLGTTAAQRAGLTEDRWTWDDIVTYLTVLWCTTKYGKYGAANSRVPLKTC